jgi:hypothetical protein
LIELTHINDMLILQNQVMGEKLKGLNDSFIHLVYKRSSEAILAEELEMIYRTACIALQGYKDIESKLFENTNDNLTLWSDLKELEGVKVSLEEQLEKLGSKAKDRIKRLAEEMNRSSQANEKLRLELEVSENNNKSLIEEHEHLKTKLKQLKNRKNNDDKETDVKVCNKCKSLYKEVENFNWSCKVHVSQYVSEYWWCCGKKGENAPGCKASRHESREEDLDLLKDDGLFSTHVLCSVFYR